MSTTPFDEVDPLLLNALRRVSKSLALEYLATKGVVPHGVPSAPALQAPPLGLLRESIPACADAEDDRHWYLTPSALDHALQGFNRHHAVQWMLRHDMLRTYPSQDSALVFVPAPHPRFKAYAVRKAALAA